MSVWFAGGCCSEWWPRFLECHWDIHEHHQATNSDDGIRPSIHLSVSMPRRVAETAHTTARELFLPRVLFIVNCAPLYLPSVLWHCWLGDRNGMWPVENWVLIFWCWQSGWNFPHVRVPLFITRQEERHLAYKKYCIVLYYIVILYVFCSIVLCWIKIHSRMIC